MTKAITDYFDLEAFYKRDPAARESAECLNASAFGLRPGTVAHRWLAQAVAAATVLARQHGGQLDLDTLCAALKITAKELADVEAEILAEAGGGSIH